MLLFLGGIILENDYMDTLKETKKIHTMYTKFRGDMKNIWEEYSYLDASISRANKEEYMVKSLAKVAVGKKTKRDAGGMQNRFLSGGNTRNHYIDAICTFENYINSLVEKVYYDYPFKMNGGGMDAQKLFKLILDKETKEDMIDVIIEEKVRSIFYGNPVEIFTKDKCKLEIGDIFESEYPDSIVYYAEITGRRNAIIHKSGRVDSKFIKENPKTSLYEGQKIVISEDYLKGTIGLLIGIAAIVSKCVVENIYKEKTQGKIGSSVITFDRCMKESWFSVLLS